MTDHVNEGHGDEVPVPDEAMGQAMPDALSGPDPDEAAMEALFEAMRCPDKVAADEFGSLAERVPPGEDPEALGKLIEQLGADLQPDNLIDRLLVHDLGRGTMLSDYMWRAFMDATACLTEDTERELAKAQTTNGETSKLPLERQVRGRTFLRHHGVLSKLAQMHRQAYDSRDRAMLLHESRRLQSMKGTLAIAEAMTKND